MRGIMAHGALIGESLSETWQRMGKALDLKPYQAERIVRTESSFAMHRQQEQDFEELFGDEKHEWRKTLITTFDQRTGEDSKFVDGQVRRVDENFQDNEGRSYPYPPNRPHGREVMVYVPAEDAGASFGADAHESFGGGADGLEAIQSGALDEALSSRVRSDGRFDPEKLRRIVKALESEGAQFNMSDAIGVILRDRGRQASDSPEIGQPGIFWFDEHPSEPEVIEELIHYGQHRRRKWRPPTRSERYSDEFEAQNMLLDIGHRRGWGDSEIEEVKAARLYWRKRLEEDGDL